MYYEYHVLRMFITMELNTEKDVQFTTEMETGSFFYLMG